MTYSYLGGGFNARSGKAFETSSSSLPDHSSEECVCEDWVSYSETLNTLLDAKYQNVKAGSEIKYQGRTILVLTADCATLEVKVETITSRLICVPCFITRSRDSDFMVYHKCTNSDEVTENTEGKPRFTPVDEMDEMPLPVWNYPEDGVTLGDLAIPDPVYPSNPNRPFLPGEPPNSAKSHVTMGVLIQKREDLRTRLTPTPDTYKPDVERSSDIDKGEIKRGWLYAGNYTDWLEWRYEHFKQTGEWLELVKIPAVPPLDSWSDTQWKLDTQGVYYNAYSVKQTPLPTGVDASAAAPTSQRSETLKDHVRDINTHETGVDPQPMAPVDHGVTLPGTGGTIWHIKPPNSGVTDILA